MIVTPLSAPDYESLIPLSLIAEFIGYDSDLDVNQDAVLPVLRAAAVQEGEQITGIVWAATKYKAETMHLPFWGLIHLPISPALSAESVTQIDEDGNEEPVTGYRLIASAIELGRPYACLELPTTQNGACKVTVTFTAGWAGADFPPSLKSWALNRIATLYDYREDVASGSVHGAMPRLHSLGLLDRYTVRISPYA